MPYENDVFISYRREQYLWTPWARDKFKRALGSYLQRELGDPANIFIDEQVPVGRDYVDYLAAALAQSKVIIPLLSRDYFSSPWCIHELDLMVERADGSDQIFPVLVHDGDVIPDAIGKLQYADFKRFATPALSETSPFYGDFCDAVGHLAPRIRSAIEDTPRFDSQWLHRFKKRLTEVYEASLAKKSIPPKQFALKRSLPPKKLPRLKP